MYGKLFTSIYDGTLASNWKGLVTFQQFIALADEQGVVDMTPDAISRRTGIPLEIIQEGITFLEKPDPCSRTPTNEGRRIERLDQHRPWGWVLVNHAKYRQLVSREEKKAADRERIAAKRAAEKTNKINDVAECREPSPEVAESSEASNESPDVADVAYTEAEATTDIKNMIVPNGTDGGKPPPCPHQKIIELYHEILPQLRQVRIWNEERQRILAKRWKEDPNRQTLEWWREYFEYVRKCPWLMGGDGKWEADLEWLVRPKNFVKVIEGKYEDAA